MSENVIGPPLLRNLVKTAVKYGYKQRDAEEFYDEFILKRRGTWNGVLKIQKPIGAFIYYARKHFYSRLETEREAAKNDRLPTCKQKFTKVDPDALFTLREMAAVSGLRYEQVKGAVRKLRAAPIAKNHRTKTSGPSFIYAGATLNEIYEMIEGGRRIVRKYAPRGNQSPRKQTTRNTRSAALEFAEAIEGEGVKKYMIGDKTYMAAVPELNDKPEAINEGGSMEPASKPETVSKPAAKTNAAETTAADNGSGAGEDPESEAGAIEGGGVAYDLPASRFEVQRWIRDAKGVKGLADFCTVCGRRRGPSWYFCPVCGTYLKLGDGGANGT